MNARLTVETKTVALVTQRHETPSFGFVLEVIELGGRQRELFVPVLHSQNQKG